MQETTKQLSEQDIQKQTDILSAIITKANKEIFNPKNKVALDYAYSRGFDDNIIKKFKIGYIPKIFYTSFQYMNQETFIDQAIKEAYPDIQKQKEYLDIAHSAKFNFNLLREINVDDNTTKFVDNFASRLIIPITDKQNRIVGFNSRHIPTIATGKDFDPPKYMNSPENDVFHKREVLFNYQNVKENWTFDKPLVLTEGEIDTIGYTKANINSLAASGIALSDYQIQMLKDLGVKKIILSYDNDSAGIEAMLKNYQLLNKAGIVVNFVDYGHLPLKDIDEIVNNKKYGPETLIKLVNNPITDIDFLFKYVQFTSTVEETKNDKSKEIHFKNENELTQKEKYKIAFLAYDMYLDINAKDKTAILLPKDKYQYFQNKLSKFMNISLVQSKDIISSFISLRKTKGYKKYHYVKGKKSIIKPQWEYFENDKTIHFVLDKLGASTSRNGFYKSLWNNDSTPSLSVKRGKNLWKDFSSGYGGGIYQLVQFLDLSDPENPKITDNPKQTSMTVAYNWLIKATGADLVQTQTTETVDSYNFSQKEKDTITKLHQIYKSTPLVPADKDMSELPEAKKQLMELYPEYFENTLQKPPFLIPIAHENSILPIFSVALMDMNSNNTLCSVNPKSKYYPFVRSTKNETELELRFDISPQELLFDKKQQIPTSYFIIPNEIDKKNLVKLFNNDYKIINIKNPSDKFIQTHFQALAATKKPIFINDCDLYDYVVNKKLVRYTEVAQTMGKYCPHNPNQDKILEKMNKSSKFNKIYFSEILEKAKKGEKYPPR